MPDEYFKTKSSVTHSLQPLCDKGFTHFKKNTKSLKYRMETLRSSNEKTLFNMLKGI